MTRKTASRKLSVGILGATGMVGQRFVLLLENHPWFEVRAVAASRNSAGKTYAEAVDGRWNYPTSIPSSVRDLIVLSVEDDVENMKNHVDFVFSAMDMEKDAVRSLEELYALMGMPVVSNNSAHRWTADVPMILPEINADHLAMIPIQQKNRGWDTGFIVVKPNCSVQSFMPALEALKQFEPQSVIVSTLQAISGAGKTFETMPEILDNVIPFIGGEEEKSEREPMKIWGRIKNGAFVLAKTPQISATCIRVPVTDGHMASINVSFNIQPTRDEILSAFRDFKSPIDGLGLPSTPEKFLTYFEEENRPQTKLDRDIGNGMGISIGRLREDPILGWKFVALSHNTIRGAAGGAILVAELLKEKGYLQAR
ncbi:MAG: aspartate-semialdehyde dehydrogenase [bacterium]|nr:aspartate-semialdehyde dehydrogenase [bacterium]